MVFGTLQLENWRQIHKIDVSFHPKLTILTGANGAGKTTILNILSMNFGWPISWASTPALSSRGFRYVIDLLKRPFAKPGEALPHGPIIGSIIYSNGAISTISAPSQIVSPTYQVAMSPQQPVRGLYIPAHRPNFRPASVNQIPTTLPNRGDHFNQYGGLIKQRWASDLGGTSPLHALKQSIMALAVFGYGSDVVRPNPEARGTFEGFQDVLRSVLPPKIGFEKIEVRMPEVVFVTRSGVWPIDAASGGVAAIVDICWQIFMAIEGDEPFVVVIDEPENHLHPEIQRFLLPNLVAAFPNAQFIVATHNPMIIGSEPDSNIFALQFNPALKVDSVPIERVDKSGTSNDILRKVLGLESTIPVWAAKRMRDLLREYEARELSDDSFQAFAEEMRRLGFGEFLPESLAELLRSNADG